MEDQSELKTKVNDSRLPLCEKINRKHSIQTFEIGPVREMVPSNRNGDLALNGVIDWLTPSASTNCSLNSTLVRPLALKWHFFFGMMWSEANNQKPCKQNQEQN